MNTLAQLQPAALWRFFAQICAIPHPSFHESALREWIKEWALNRGIGLEQDAVGNLILRKAASPGMQTHPGVILQAHLDMVGQKRHGFAHDFTADPIQPWVDGEWVRAKETTLGADNGVGMASALAVLEADDLSHGPLEVLLTTNEESGMDGAFGLESGLLKGTYFINTDSEQMGEIYIGCAGGGDTEVVFELQCMAAKEFDCGVVIEIGGLKGGHSGCDIHLGRGNANILMGRFMHLLNREGLIFALAKIEGGSLRNAIPRDARVELLLTRKQFSLFEQLLARFSAEIAGGYALIDPGFFIRSTPIEQLPERCFAADFQKRLLQAWIAAPDGVCQKDSVVAGVVDTSLNFGLITTDDRHVVFSFLIRALKDGDRIRQEQQLALLFSGYGARVSFSNDYPGWQPDPGSELLDKVSSEHRRLFGNDAKISVIHAGLECGLFINKYPHWQMVSIGPTIQSPHSPDERVNIHSVAQFWQWLTAVLAAL